MKRVFLFNILVMMCMLPIYAQKKNLRSLPEQERNKYLVTTARESMLEYAPNWYRSDINPEVFFFGESKNGEDPGRNLYEVAYKIDKIKEPDNWDFMSRVLIWEDTGEIAQITLGIGWCLVDFTKQPKVSEGKASETPPFYERIPSKRPTRTVVDD